MPRITASQIEKLLEKQSYKCAITGRPLDPNTASLDHIIPLSRGGKHCIENAQIVHKEINRMKSQLTMEEFIKLCQEVCINTSGPRKPAPA